MRSEPIPLRALWERVDDSLRKELAWASWETMTELQKSSDTKSRKARDTQPRLCPCWVCTLRKGEKQRQREINMAGSFFL